MSRQSPSSPGVLTAPAKASLLLRAAESIAANRAFTVVDILHGKALKHYAEGLRQYLAIRLASTAEAEHAMQKVRAVVAARSSDELVGPPGIRAHLYRIARDVAHSHREQRAIESGRLPWRRPGQTRRAQRLEALRAGLSESDAEILELRHARELRPVEIAFVLDESVEEILERLEVATRSASKLLKRRPDDMLRKLLLEAFALDGLSATIRSSDGSFPSATALPPGSVIGGRYSIQACVGTGAFGDVYRAEDAEVPGHVVALKILHQAAYSEEARQTALRELRLIASVFHPSVVQFKDHGWHEQRLWFVMPWYDGETLQSRLQRKPLTRDEALQIFVPLARALAAVHAAGIRHQDVKPDNVFLAELPGFGETEILPVLIDLGVAATEAEMLVAGTPTYFAPEVAAQFATVKRKPRVTKKADVFSLALALRNALEPSTADDVPAGAIESFIEDRARHSAKPPSAKSLKFLEPQWRRWLAYDADDRPTAEELATELQVLTAPEERRKRRHRLLRWVVPTGLTLAMLFTGIYLHLDGRARAHRLRADRAAQVVESVREDLLATQSHSRLVQASAVRLQRTRAQLEAEVAASNAALVQADREGERQHARIEDLRSEVTAAARAATSLEAQLDELRGQYSESQTSRESLSAALEDTQERLSQERERERRLQSQLEGATERLASAEARAAAAQARVAAADARSDALEAELEHALRQRLEAPPAATEPQAEIPVEDSEQ